LDIRKASSLARTRKTALGVHTLHLFKKCSASDVGRCLGSINVSVNLKQYTACSCFYILHCMFATLVWKTTTGRSMLRCTSTVSVVVNAFSFQWW